MLRLNNTVVERYNSALEHVDITDIQTIHDLVECYKGLFVKQSLPKSEAIALNIVMDNISNIISESFDYRSAEFEYNINRLYEALDNLPRCNITEPLFIKATLL